MSDDVETFGAIAATAFIIVYVATVVITGSLWGPIALIIDWLCVDLPDSLAVCG